MADQKTCETFCKNDRNLPDGQNGYRDGGRTY